jgi:hypothetical protein
VAPTEESAAAPQPPAISATSTSVAPTRPSEPLEATVPEGSTLPDRQPQAESFPVPAESAVPSEEAVATPRPPDISAASTLIAPTIESDQLSEIIPTEGTSDTNTQTKSHEFTVQPKSRLDRLLLLDEESEETLGEEQTPQLLVAPVNLSLADSSVQASRSPSSLSETTETNTDLQAITKTNPDDTATVASANPVELKSELSATSSTVSAKSSSEQPELPASAAITNQDIPDSWSSIAELLGEKTFTEQESVIVQPLLESNPSGYESVSMNFIPSRDSISSTTDEFQVNSPITPIQSSVVNGIIQTDVATDVRETPATPEEEIEEEIEERTPSQEETDRLEVLAREIYNLLRQRLEVERERQGQYYSGRLPW